MLKPKIVFTILAAWFTFHIFIFWVLNPTGVEALVEGEKGQFMARVMGYIGGTLSMMIAYIFLLFRSPNIKRRITLRKRGSRVLHIRTSWSPR